MATIQKRSGSWQAFVKKKGFGQIARAFDTKAEAENWAKIAESEMTRGIFATRKEAENTPLAEALDLYEREISSVKKGKRREKARIDRWKTHPGGIRYLSQIQGKGITEYRGKRLKEVAPNPVRLELDLLSHLFTISVKGWGIAGLVNPVMQIRKPDLPQGRDRRLFLGELERIVTGSESPVLSDIVRFALETGMRRGELAEMTWENVNLKKRTLILPETKNGEKRIVLLSKEAVRIVSDSYGDLMVKFGTWSRTRLHKPFFDPLHAPELTMRRNVKKKNVAQSFLPKRSDLPRPQT